MIAGQHHDGTPEHAEPSERFADQLRRHFAVIEEVPGNDHGIYRSVNGQTEYLLETEERFVRVDVASQVEVRGVEQFE